MNTDYNPLAPGELEPPTPLLPTPPVPAANPPWTLWDVASIALLVLISIQLLGLAAFAIATRAFHVPVAGLERSPKLAVPVEFVAYLLTLAFMAVLVRSRGVPFWRTVEWRWTGSPLRYIAYGFLLAMGIGLASSVLPIPKQLPIEKYFADTLGAWILAIFGVTMAPLMEELFFRGFLCPALARPLGVRWSVLITSFAFALVHSSQLAEAWAPLFLLFLVGVVLTMTRVRTGSVVPGFFIHAAYNLTLFVQLYFATDHFHNFDKLGG